MFKQKAAVFSVLFPFLPVRDNPLLRTLDGCLNVTSICGLEQVVTYAQLDGFPHQIPIRVGGQHNELNPWDHFADFLNDTL